MNLIYFKIICLFCILLSSCESKRDRAVNIVEEWQGKTIILPSIKQYLPKTSNGDDSILIKDTSVYDFTILSYIDTLGCENCKLQLNGWKNYINKVLSTSRYNVKFAFYFSTRNVGKIKNILEQQNFFYPVYFDYSDSLNILNKLPKQFRYQTFLLDKDNKVILVGNPIINENINKLYSQCLGISISHPSTTASVERRNIDFGRIKIGKVYEKVLHIYNTGDRDLEIYNIFKSCDCISVDVPCKIVASHKSMNIKISYVADKNVEFFESVRIETNSKPEIPTVEIHGIVN